jgi:hypothetical protein
MKHTKEFLLSEILANQNELTCGILHIDNEHVQNTIYGHTTYSSWNMPGTQYTDTNSY